uniref:Uncharacterized protein n=1 Tax=Cucumis sativus TaxID=3659 RepID=A0A0A0K747_CUCSA
MLRFLIRNRNFNSISITFKLRLLRSNRPGPLHCIRRRPGFRFRRRKSPSRTRFRRTGTGIHQFMIEITITNIPSLPIEIRHRSPTNNNLLTDFLLHPFLNHTSTTEIQPILLNFMMINTTTAAAAALFVPRSLCSVENEMFLALDAGGIVNGAINSVKKRRRKRRILFPVTGTMWMFR